MRRTVLLLGAGLFAIGAGAFYYVLGAPSAAEIIAIARGEQRIAPGFIGVANFGRWRLICVPGPPTLDGLGAPTDSAGGPSTGNSCRVNQEMPSSGQAAAPGGAPADVIVAANFSLVGPKRMPAAMLRLPPTARAGDVISLRFDDQSAVKTVVRDCAPQECVAAGTLTPADWEHLLDTATMQVTFPAAGRQWVILDLPVEGLAAAMRALDRADTSSLH